MRPHVSVESAYLQVIREIKTSDCPLRTGAYQPGCSTVAVNRGGCLPFQPVLDLELRHPLEVALVASYDFEMVRECDRSYAQVGVAYGSAQSFQLGTDLTVASGCSCVEG